MNYIEVENLTKKLNRHLVLDHIYFRAKKGKIYGLFGRNGSGKTMFFRALCGLIKPTTGTVTIDGEKLHRDISFPRSVGVIIESPGFWDHLTGYENLQLLAKIKNQIGRAEIEESLERVGLRKNDHRIYKNYSLGMKQRLAIAQAIMESPELLVLDEPTNTLDEDGVELIRSILLEENERGATILISSHNREDLDRLAHIQLKMENGKLHLYEKKRKKHEEND